jgi:hypothetical protein
MHAYIGGQEGGVTNLLRLQGVHVQTKPARLDKMGRALSAASEWNRGQIFVPESGGEWVDTFVGELLNFSGADSGTDDQVDAFVAAFDAAPPSAAFGQVIAFQPPAATHRYDGQPQAAQQAPVRAWKPGAGPPRKNWE